MMKNSSMPEGIMANGQDPVYGQERERERERERESSKTYKSGSFYVVLWLQTKRDISFPL